MRLSTRNARYIRHGISLGRLAIGNDKPISPVTMQCYTNISMIIYKAYMRTMEPYNQLNDLRRVVNGN